MWQSAELYFAAGHPAAAGHFPGNPIIPGALLLDAVIEAVIDAASTATTPASVTIRAAKFLQPVRPGDHVALRWRRDDTGLISFECHLAEHGKAAAGTLEWTP